MLRTLVNGLYGEGVSEPVYRAVRNQLNTLIGKEAIDVISQMVNFNPDTKKFRTSEPNLWLKILQAAMAAE